MRPLRILYVAIDQTVPGTVGGSIHVQAVAEGLSAIGHDVHVAVRPGGRWPAGRVHWHAMRPPFGSARLRWLARGRIAGLARRIGAQVILERYYNFGGEGVFAAGDAGIPAALEVNAPMVDVPGSRKQWIDRALVVEPLRRWRDRIARQTSLFITPAAETLPSWVDRRRILETEWGADTVRFTPEAPGAPPYHPDPSRILCVFAGAFRSWHGAAHLSAALARLHNAGDHRFGGIFIGDGPERQAAERQARGVPGIVFTGRLAHEALPAALRHAHVGLAPFDPTRHLPLQLGFYWSPLKVFEYMAAGLPVVAPRLPRLARLVEDGVEGLLYDPEDPRGIDEALAALADPDVRRRMGSAARARAVRDFSWQAHCRELSARLQEIV